MRILQKILQTWVAWVLPRPRVVVGLAVALAVASLWLTVTRLGMNTDQLSLISRDHPLIPLTERLEPFNFDGETGFTVVIRAPSPQKAVAFARSLERRILDKRDRFQEVFYRIDPDQLRKWALLYLDEEDLLKIRKTLENDAALIHSFVQQPDITSFLRILNKEMSSRMIREFFTGFLDEDAAGSDTADSDEPMDMGVLIETLKGLSAFLNGSEEYHSPWASFFNGPSVNLELEGYFWEAGKEFLIMTVIPVKQKGGFTSEFNCLECLRDQIRETQIEFADVQVGVTGQEALNTDEMLTVSRDMARATRASLLGVLTLMFLFLRSLRRPFVELFSLGIGLSWTFGWATLFIGHLNIISIIFAPLLCGLGVDYGIHWFARIEEEERQSGVSAATIVRRVAERSGPGILIAGFSTSLSLLPFVLTGFRGLMELGLITGTGILMTLLADLILLPAFSGLLIRSRARKRSALKEIMKKDVLRLSRKAAAGVLILTGVLCIFSIVKAREVSFDLNPLRLQAPNAEAVVWEKLLLEKSKRSPLSVAVFAGSPEEVQVKSSKIAALPSVSEVESLFSFLPENQDEKLPLLRSFVPLLPHVEETRNRTTDVNPVELIDVLERIRFKLQDSEAEKWGASRPVVEQMIVVRNLADEIIAFLKTPSSELEGLRLYAGKFHQDLVNTWSLLREGANASPMLSEDIPKELRSRFYNDGSYLVRAYPKESIWEEGTLSRFVKDLQSVDPEVVGDPVSLYVFASAFKRACLQSSGYSVLFIFILLTFTFRSFSLSLLALLPLTTGALFTIGIMGIVGIQFNLANSIFMPLVVGAGVEYGVIILNRWREGRMLPGHLPYSTGKGVLLASLTTTVGFGTLMISDHQGIFSLGFVAWEGSICVVVSALIVLPAVLAWMRQPSAEFDREEIDEKNMVVFNSDCRSITVYRSYVGDSGESRRYCRRFPGSE